MGEFEFWTKELLIFGLDEPFDITFGILSIVDVKKVDDDKLESYVLKFIGYMLETGYVEVGDWLDVYGFKAWNITAKEAVGKIRKIWDNSESITYLVWFNLTEKGFKKAILYSLYEIRVDEKLTLKAEKKGFITLSDAVEIVKTEFKTNDAEEIRRETLNMLDRLGVGIIWGTFKNSMFSSWFAKDEISTEKLRGKVERIKKGWDIHIAGAEKEKLWMRGSDAVNKKVRLYNKRKGCLRLKECGWLEEMKEEFEKKHGKPYASA